MLLFFSIGENTPPEPEIPAGLVIVAELSLKYETPVLTLELDTIDDS